MRRTFLLIAAVSAFTFALVPGLRGETGVQPADPQPIDPIKTTARGCICPHAGAGWVYTGDNCKLQLPGAQVCTGNCNWKNADGDTTTTICGTP